ncbi:hypothetical protein ACFOYW_00465 [Gryllotalpicola reticulitermitis]|uniref:DUF1648 domain-containing protein n=1 Tax=Gryllotalpicola reticulitermitis TaxID=1184153 RepID=A0ABV8Q291_9MICO
MNTMSGGSVRSGYWAVREVGAGILAVLPPAGLAAAAITLAPHLGSKMASHWSGGSARPDGFASTWGSFWVYTSITVVLFVVAVIGIVLVRRAAWSRVWAAIATVVGGLTAFAWAGPAWATAAADRPEDAVLGFKLLLLIGAVVVGAGIYLLLPAAPAPSTRQAVRPHLPVADGERVAWSGVIISRSLESAIGLLAAIFLGTLVLALVTRQGGTWTAVIVLFLATLSALLIAPVRLTVDQRGIRLVSVLLRVPLIRVKLANIDTVTADTINPASWGGWGYRVGPAGIAYVARRGPGIVITRRTGGAIAITVDHPEQPAAAANGLISTLPAPRR